MSADGTIPEASNLKSFAGRAARNVPAADTAASSIAAISQAGAAPGTPAEKAATPFYDLLTAMIRAHAVESGRAPQSASVTGNADAVLADAADAREGKVNAIQPGADRRRRGQYLNACVAGLIVAMGGFVYVPEAGKGRPPLVAADEGREGKSAVIGIPNATGIKPVEMSLQAREPAVSATAGVEEGRTSEGEIGPRRSPVAHSGDRTVAASAVGQPVEKPASGPEERADDAAQARTSSEAARSDPAAPATSTGDRTVAASVDGQPMEKPASGPGNRADDAAQARTSSKAVGSDPAASATSTDDRTVATSLDGQPMEKHASGPENRADDAAQARTSSGAVRTDPTAPATSWSERTVATRAVGQPTEEPASGPENRADDVAEAGTSSGAARSDPAAPATGAAGKQSSPPDASPSPPLASDTGPAADDPGATPVARTNADVHMRAGPGNGRAVLTTIPQDSPVELIKCRQWCEVIFAGQRGWVYKRFIEAPPFANQR